MFDLSFTFSVAFFTLADLVERAVAYFIERAAFFRTLFEFTLDARFFYRLKPARRVLFIGKKPLYVFAVSVPGQNYY